MQFMDFGNKWMKWIHGCLYLAKASILVNGSPTGEFHVQRGIRQGDPLSRLLFIIMMEALHVVVKDAIHAMFFLLRRLVPCRCLI